ncbi:MAG TPA: hemolysin family protein, partial [Oceanipulchritudo sp.]|nr:hemolysin family protein [Oceanipulchritudo sp.]
LTLNTIANTAGATIIGALAAGILDSAWLGFLSAGLVLAILLFSEIIPKNIGVAYRKQLQVYLVYPLWLIRILMFPLSYFAQKMLTVIVTHEAPTEQEQEEEIRLLAERSAQSGALSDDERDLISNALSLDDVNVEEIMTPRTVVTFLKDSLTVEEVCRDFRNIPFARIPVYGETIDEIIGIVRRRDILEANSDDKGNQTMRDLKGDALFIPETASGLQALQQFMKKHQQIAVVVDEYGSTVGVITMEDIVEQLLGEEIYEESDMAVDMRELAKRRAERLPSVTPNSPPEEKIS